MLPRKLSPPCHRLCSDLREKATLFTSMSPLQPQNTYSPPYLRNSLKKYNVVTAMTLRYQQSLFPHPVTFLPKDLHEQNPFPQADLTYAVQPQAANI